MEVRSKDGRLFVLDGEKPYQRKDGTFTKLRLWKTSCVECGGNFVVSAPYAAKSQKDSNSFAIRRCASCRPERHTPEEWVHIIRAEVQARLAVQT